MSTKEKLILDACCGGRMFWFVKEHPNTIFQDFRERKAGHCKHRPNHNISPDNVVDYKNMPYSDESFYLVVFDPPHLFGKETGNMTKQYGWLTKETWQAEIKGGFDECWRVLKEKGVLIFKWNESQISKKDVLTVIGKMPLFGNKPGAKTKTHWLCFMKISE